MKTEYSYCIRECDHLDCKHNKKNLKHIEVNGYKPIAAIGQKDFRTCNKGENVWEDMTIQHYIKE